MAYSVIVARSTANKRFGRGVVDDPPATEMLVLVNKTKFVVAVCGIHNKRHKKPGKSWQPRSTSMIVITSMEAR